MDDLPEDKIKENLQSQLSEIEMLQSMFPNPGEVKLDETFVIKNVEAYLNGKTDITPPFADLTFNLLINDLKFELCITLSHEYPSIEPDIFIRNEKLNRTQHTQINKDCKEFVCNLERGEPCIFSAISWLQDNATNYVMENKQELVKTKTELTQDLTRLWIYSHHIYSKTKRREIISLANGLNITGFCMPGKPGIICVEGFTSDCNEWWQTIKSMTWKRIFCKLTEECNHPETFIKFKTFEEVSFQSSGARVNHMDMGELHKYLERHGIDYIFKDLFGIDKND